MKAKNNIPRQNFLKDYLIKLALISSTFLLLNSSCINVDKSNKERPNILFVISDDQSWLHTSINDDPVVKTPVFDRIATEGVLFKYAFCAAPSCTPSRGAICTGQNIWRLEQGGDLWSTLPKKFITYQEILESNGYAIGFTGKGWGPGYNEPGGRSQNPAGPAYNRIETNDELSPSRKRVYYPANFIDFYNKKEKGQPFCFWFGSRDPHRGYEEGSGIKAGKQLSNVKVPSFLPDCPEVRSDLLDYYCEIERFDSDLGVIVDFLEEKGELDNTIIVVTGDNGMPFPRGKCTLYDYGVREPLAIRWPQKVRGGRVIDDFVSFIDFAPTFLEAVGLTPPSEMTGKSFYNLLTSEKSGKIDTSRTKVFCAMERHTWCRLDNMGYPMRSIRTYDYLYIRNYEPDRWPSGDPERWWWRETFDEIDPGPTKHYMMENRDSKSVSHLFKLAFNKRPSEELYDLKNDPDQMNNVADQPQYETIKQKLRDELVQYLKETNDPRETNQRIMWDCYEQYCWGPVIRSYDGTKFKVDESSNK